LKKRAAIQLLLFIITFITTTLAGAEWMFGRPFQLPIYQPNPLLLSWPHFWQGLWFSVPFLGILSAHEFGHYLVAKAHKVKVSLPYYIPVWFGGIVQVFGTMGAFIRIEEQVTSRKKYFDIGIAGPLAGFVVAFGVLWYGFANLPTLDYIFTVHPEYKKFGLGFARVVYEKQNLSGSVLLGDNLLFSFFKTFVADPTRLPPPQEIMHYPLILAGYLSLFFTALNLIPIGQLDGGHILYGLIGERANKVVAPTLFWIFVTYAGWGMFKPSDFIATQDKFIEQVGYMALYVLFLQFCYVKMLSNPLTSWVLALLTVLVQFGLSMSLPQYQGYDGFLVFAFLIGRVLGVQHPPTTDAEPLDFKRKILGWFALIVFVLCFSPHPFIEL
jgi:membrane-associated protease RseP (regulator of RpoE activity)